MVSHSKCHIVSHSDTDDSLRNSSDSIAACSETELLHPLLVMTHLQSLAQNRDRHEQASAGRPGLLLDFQIPCFRPETPVLYLRSLLTNHKGHGRELKRPRRL